MAIDTADKRRSVAGVPLGTGITPDATNSLAWRQQVGWSYSGIPAASPPVGTFLDSMFKGMFRGMFRGMQRHVDT